MIIISNPFFSTLIQFPTILHFQQIAFQVLVKALISLDPGQEMEFLRKQFQEFIAGLMSLPINIPGTRLYRSLQVFSSPN